MYPVTNTVCQKMSEWITKQIRLGSVTDGIDAKDVSNILLYFQILKYYL